MHILCSELSSSVLQGLPLLEFLPSICRIHVKLVSYPAEAFSVSLQKL